MNTWIGDPRASLRRARETAREILRQLDNPRATAAARRELIATLTNVAYTARPDYVHLEQAIRDVFEPGSEQVRRAVGHPDAPLVADSVIDLVKARLTAVRLLAAGQADDQVFYHARQVHLVAYAEYAVRWQMLAAAAPAQEPCMYEPVTAEIALNSACGHLLTTIGMAVLYPERAAQLSASASPVAARAAQQVKSIFLTDA